MAMAADATRAAHDDDEVEFAPRDLLTVPQQKIIEGRRMRCPRCENLHDILTYVPMQVVEKFAAETNPIYKCPSCRWIFSPQPRYLEDTI
jgi:uncharacterized protein with PIN domain